MLVVRPPLGLRRHSRGRMLWSATIRAVGVLVLRAAGLDRCQHPKRVRLSFARGNVVIRTYACCVWGAHCWLGTEPPRPDLKKGFLEGTLAHTLQGPSRLSSRGLLSKTIPAQRAPNDTHTGEPVPIDIPEPNRCCSPITIRFMHIHLNRDHVSPARMWASAGQQAVDVPGDIPSE